VVGAHHAPREFLRVLRFSFLQKNPTSPNSNSTRIEDQYENHVIYFINVSELIF